MAEATFPSPTCDTRVAAQISAVAPWFDITNSYQRHWIRTHRWKTPDYRSEYSPGWSLALANMGSLPGPDDTQRDPLSGPMDMHAHL